MTDPSAIRDAIRDQALSLGFDAIGFAPAEAAPGARSGLADYLSRGYHGDMGWLAAKADIRPDPARLWPEARTVVVLGSSYAPSDEPLANLARPDRGNISVYARSARDYHDVLKKRLKAMGRWLQETYGGNLKVFVDTAPVMEKPLAARAGVGWQGKHTNLVSREFGSWLFLGELFTTIDLPHDEPEEDHCGSCRRCLDACPTQAFPAPYRLDARRCISYLTIEHKGHVPRELRPAIGNRIYGCDDCVAVCPWNKFAKRGRLEELWPRMELQSPRLRDLAELDDEDFRSVFAGSPIKRTGRDRFVRNVLIAIGNSGDRFLAPVAADLLDDPSALVRAMAVWASGKLMEPAEFMKLRERLQPVESDPNVRNEWNWAAADLSVAAARAINPAAL